MQTLQDFENPTLGFAPARGGLTAAHLSHEGAAAVVYLHGAHVASFVPAGRKEALFLSDRAIFDGVAPIRGGVPVCFPQFANRPTPGGATGLPNHGFLRNKAWRVQHGGIGTVTLQTQDDAETRRLWPFAFNATLTVTLDARALTVALQVTNTGVTPFVYADALHTYLAVSDVRQVEVLDLTGPYLDQLTGRVLGGTSPTTIRGELDRIYHANSRTVRVRDGVVRTLVVEKHGSRSTVLWNPDVVKAARLKDLADDEWRQFICVEAGNIDDDAVRLEPHATHTTATTLRAE